MQTMPRSILNYIEKKGVTSQRAAVLRHFQSSPKFKNSSPAPPSVLTTAHRRLYSTTWQEQLPLVSTCGLSQHCLCSVNNKYMRKESSSSCISPFPIAEELRGITKESTSLSSKRVTWKKSAQAVMYCWAQQFGHCLPCSSRGVCHARQSLSAKTIKFKLQKCAYIRAR